MEKEYEKKHTEDINDTHTKETPVKLLITSGSLLNLQAEQSYQNLISYLKNTTSLTVEVGCVL